MKYFVITINSSLDRRKQFLAEDNEHYYWTDDPNKIRFYSKLQEVKEKVRELFPIEKITPFTNNQIIPALIYHGGRINDQIKECVVDVRIETILLTLDTSRMKLNYQIIR